ncbi:MAG: hypothetical protein IT376_16835 [Polyangiaceae bacterium]|nr:hypothetical protein [Polyangiaceae bacterium]
MRIDRLFYACLTSALLASACGHPVQKKLEGRWLGDGVEGFDDAEIAAVTGWAKGVSLELAGSTATVSIPAHEPRKGTYEVARVHQNDVSLAFKRGDGTIDRAAFKLDDERTLRWVLGAGRAVVLRRE